MSDRDKEKGKDRREVVFEGDVDLQSAVAHLEALVAALKSGTLSIEQGVQTLTVHPAGSIALAVKVKSKVDREAVSLELAWERVVRPQVSTGLRISDKEIPRVRAVEG